MAPRRAPSTPRMPSLASPGPTILSRNIPSKPLKAVRMVCTSPRSPRTDWTPGGSLASVRRGGTLTWGLRLSSSETTCEPTVPVPPVTRIFMGGSFPDVIDQRRGQSCSVNREETVRNRRFPEGKKKQRPVHGLDTADPCEKRSQSRIMEFGHHFRVGDRRAALQRCRVAQDIGLVRQLRWRIHCRVLLPRFRGTRPPTKPFDGFPDRLRMRAVVGLEPLGDGGAFRVG